MKKCVGLVVGLLSVSTAYASQEEVVHAIQEEIVFADRSNENSEALQSLPVVTKENFAELFPKLWRQGGMPSVKRELARLVREDTEQFLKKVFNPSLEEQPQGRMALPLEFAARTNNAELVGWLLRNNADPSAKNRFGIEIQEVIKNSSFLDLIAVEKKRKKIEPLVIDALQGVSLEEVATDLRKLVEKDDELTSDDLENVLETIVKEYENDTAVITNLLLAYKNQPSIKPGNVLTMNLGKVLSGYTPPFLGGIAIGSFSFFVLNKYIKPAVE